MNKRLEVFSELETFIAHDENIQDPTTLNRVPKLLQLSSKKRTKNIITVLKKNHVTSESQIKYKKFNSEQKSVEFIKINYLIGIEL